MNFLRTLRLALGAALLGALAEVASIALRRSGLHQMVFLSRDHPWLAPLGNLALFTVLALVLAGLTGWLAPRRRYALQGGVLAALAAAGVLLCWPQLSDWAVGFLALGLGARVGTWCWQAGDQVDRLVRRSLPVLALLTVLVGAGSILAARRTESGMLAALPPPRPGAPNVLLIIWDTVREQNVSAYGYARPTTPVFDSLAQRGARFAHAITAAPWTLPAHASMFTGRWAHEHGADWLVPLDDRYPVVAQAFDSAGYRTGGFVANMFYASHEHGLARGFSRYRDFRPSAGEALYSAALGRALTDQATLRRLTGYYQEIGFNTAEDVNRMFLDWADRPSERPFFGFLNYIDAHVPRLVPAPWDAKFGDPARRPFHLIRYDLHHANMLGWVRFGAARMQTELDAYDGGIAYLDHATGELVNALAARGILDSTIVVIASDHGELFGEHGVGGHGTSLYRTAIEVPLLILAPGRVPMGVTLDTPISLRDLPLTLLELAGARDPFGFPGRSLGPLLRGENVLSVDTLLAELGPQADVGERFPKIGTGMATVIADGFQYIRNGNQTEELYAFPGDPEQLADLSLTPAGQALLPKYRALLPALPH